MKRALWVLLIALMLFPNAQSARPEPAPLDEADFSIELPGGMFNLVTDTRGDLERVTGRAFEFYDQFSDLDYAYDRLLTATVNFFANVDAQRVNQANFKEGALTERGIGIGSTQAEVREAYGEEFWFNEHGYIRTEYTLDVGDDCYQLLILIYEPDDRVISIHMNGPASENQNYNY